MKLPVLASQGLRYLVTGGAAAVVDIGGFWLLSHWGLAVLPAAIASFCVAAVVNFTATSLFVFAARVSLGRFGAFFAFALAGLALNASVTWGLAAAGLAPVLAKTGGVAVAFGVNFAMNALIVFRKSPQKNGG